MENLMRLSAVEQARLIRKGEVSADEMVEAAITQIEKLNPDLNAGPADVRHGPCRGG